jgi:hypothetical protein
MKTSKGDTHTPRIFDIRRYRSRKQQNQCTTKRTMKARGYHNTSKPSHQQQAAKSSATQEEMIHRTTMGKLLGGGAADRFL